MITRFRVEGQASNKVALTDELQECALALIKHASCENQFPNGMWECTQDVLDGIPGNYIGRMVFKFRKQGENDE